MSHGTPTMFPAAALPHGLTPQQAQLMAHQLEAARRAKTPQHHLAAPSQGHPQLAQPGKAPVDPTRLAMLRQMALAKAAAAQKQAARAQARRAHRLANVPSQVSRSEVMGEVVTWLRKPVTLGQLRIIHKAALQLHAAGKAHTARFELLRRVLRYQCAHRQAKGLPLPFKHSLVPPQLPLVPATNSSSATASGAASDTDMVDAEDEEQEEEESGSDSDDGREPLPATEVTQLPMNLEKYYNLVTEQVAPPPALVLTAVPGVGDLERDDEIIPSELPTWRRKARKLTYAGPPSFDGDRLPIPAYGLGPVLQPRGPIAPDGWRVLQCAEEGTRDAIHAAGIAALERSLKRAETDNDEELVQRLRIQVKAARLAHRQAQLRAQLLLEHLKGTGRLTEAQATAATTLARVSQGRRAVGPHGPAFDGLGAGAGAGAVPGASSWTAQVLAQEVDGLAMASDGIARRHRVEPPPRSADAFEREVARRKHERDTRRRQERQTFLKAIQAHGREFFGFHRNTRLVAQRAAKAVKAHLETLIREREREADREERARIRALKANDMDKYLELVQTAKNDRIQFLLNQTDAALRDIGALVSKHQDEQDEEPATSAPAAAAASASASASGGAAAGAGAGAGAVGTPVVNSAMTAEAVEGLVTGEGAQPPALRRVSSTASASSSATASSAARVTSPKKQQQVSYYDRLHKVRTKVEQQPKMLIGGTLKSYQMEGLQWMVSLYNNNLNGILADEMGLGKTIQTIALLAYLMESKGNNGPFLIVVPLSTISNWDHELQKWAPDVRTVVYKGTPPKRKEIYARSIATRKFNVVLTTYTYIMRDKNQLRKLKWQYIIIDEGHRMKNAHCKFSLILGQQYTSRNRLLLTGTPLQNNLPELWALLNFLLPKIFNSVENFESWFNKPLQSFGAAQDDKELSKEETLLVIHRLHQVLRPFLLRRLKSQVLGQLPDKVERVLRCELSAWQKVMYQQVQQHGKLMTGRGQTKAAKTLANTLVHLRKICNHPYLFEDEYHVNDNLWRTSTKFELLDRMLPKLKAAGHRVLIFSQMTKLMTLLEDFLAYRGMRYLRLDGHTTADDREQGMWMFNASDSPYFVFLLSTRAGGLGINLATADTVIIFDSDWNPTMDAQAQDRAHRIGQTREVLVFRLVTNTPVEDRVLNRATEKQNMEAVVIEAGNFNTSANRKGAADRKAMLEELLDADQETTGDDVAEDEQINEMLMRTEDEFELFQRLDRERKAREAADWAERKARKEVSGRYPGRLLTMAEVPEHVHTVESLFDETIAKEKELLDYGAGKRERKKVAYTDGLTDRQFLRLVESNADEDEWKAASQRSRNRKRKGRPRSTTPASASASASDSGAAVAAAPVKRKPGRPRGRGRGARLAPGTHAMRARLNKLVETVWHKVKNCTDKEGKSITYLFMDKPSRKEYPEYHQIIKKPIGLNDIKRKIGSRRYRNKGEFDNDMELLFTNAETYNREDSMVFHYAKQMKAVFEDATAELPFTLEITQEDIEADAAAGR